MEDSHNIPLLLSLQFSDSPMARPINLSIGLGALVSRAGMVDIVEYDDEHGRSGNGRDMQHGHGETSKVVNNRHV